MTLTLPRRLERAAVEDPAARDWSLLTTLAEKASYYSLDTYFRQAWSDVGRQWGDLAPGLVHGLASVLFRPDAVVGRRIPACLDFLALQGFLPVRVQPLRMSRHMALDLWRYQHNAGTLDRIAATEELVCAADSLYVLLLDTSEDRTVPATVRLRRLKGNGAGDPSGTGPTLRSTARIVNRIMAMVHTADEPMDLVRELGIYFDAARRRDLLRLPLEPFDPTAVLDALHAANPEVELDPEAALRRLRSRLGHERGHGPVARHLADVASGGAKLDWLFASAELDCAIPQWDRVLVATHYIDYDESDDMLILGTGEAEWHSSAVR
jgi:hypothetical protein